MPLSLKIFLFWIDANKNKHMKGTDTALYIFGILAIMMVLLMLMDMFGVMQR